MPLTLPVGTLPTPRLWTPDDALAGSYVSAFRVELLDRTEKYPGVLDGVQPGGSVKEVSNQSVHGSGSLTVLDLGQDIDWLNTLLRPVKTVTAQDGSSTDYPLGLFIPALPKDSWSDDGRSWDLDLTDKLGLLDTNIPTDTSISPTPVSFGVAAGDNALDVVRGLIEQAGGTTQAIGPGDEVMPSAISWDVGTSTLKIINDILNSAGYFSLWCDRQGQYRVTQYVQTTERIPVYSGRTPFTDGESSMMAPEWERSQDIYDVPNCVLAISQGDGDNAAMTSVAINDDPSSPFSITSRKTPWSNGQHWKVYDGREATSQASLDSQALMLLSQRSAVASTYQITHDFLPALAMNQAIEFVTSDRYGGRNELCYITSLEIPLDATSRCTSSIAAAIGADLGMPDDGDEGDM